MKNVHGYTNSQTWEAWKDTLNVLWENTEIVFLVSVTISLGAVIYTWLHYPRNVETRKNSENPRVSSEASDNALNSAVRNGEEILNNLSEESVSHTAFKLPPNTKELTHAIERRMSTEDREKEKEFQDEQLTAIYKLMQDQREKFGDTSLDDIKSQMKFYCR